MYIQIFQLEITLFFTSNVLSVLITADSIWSMSQSVHVHREGWESQRERLTHFGYNVGKRPPGLA